MSSPQSKVIVWSGSAAVAIKCYDYAYLKTSKRKRSKPLSNKCKVNQMPDLNPKTFLMTMIINL
ncbi:hypothetical protein OUZ56_019681 [Daphnia magna]|uniref:Uncharacterized protein n=1 Tax=Daphnia magna TaxID=35525 RepID=A0ABQ9ZC95_9CRUS|nr:hypothetical protein OUZ56_019681 [Daphnia magna]